MPLSGGVVQDLDTHLWLLCGRIECQRARTSTLPAAGRLARRTADGSWRAVVHSVTPRTWTASSLPSKCRPSPSSLQSYRNATFLGGFGFASSRKSGQLRRALCWVARASAATTRKGCKESLGHYTGPFGSGLPVEALRSLAMQGSINSTTKPSARLSGSNGLSSNEGGSEQPCQSRACSFLPSLFA